MILRKWSAKPPTVTLQTRGLARCRVLLWPEKQASTEPDPGRTCGGDGAEAASRSKAAVTGAVVQLPVGPAAVRDLGTDKPGVVNTRGLGAEVRCGALRHYAAQLAFLLRTML